MLCFIKKTCHLRLILLLFWWWGNHYVYILIRDTVVFICKNWDFKVTILFAARTTSSAQQDPSSTSSQDHQETGFHRFRNCTVNKDADSRTKHTDNATKTTSTVTAFPLKSGCFYPHIPRSLSQLDKMNTSLWPTPSYHLFSFLISHFCFAFSLKILQSATGSMLHRWVVTEFVDAVYDRPCHFNTWHDMRLCSDR